MSIVCCRPSSEALRLGKLFFLGLLASVAVVSLARPWIGVVASYVIAILTPQAIWYWNFDGLRPAFYVLVPTLIGFTVALLRGQLDFSTMRNWRVGFFLLLWLAFTISYVFGPYVDAMGPYRFTDPAWAFSTLNKIFIVWVLAVVCLDDEGKLKGIAISFVVCVAYMIYWANDQYLSGRVMGRLMGPVDVTGVGTYADENNFSMLFVVAQPFLWYLGHAIPQKPLRWALWLVIPFGWHAVFLTASRGGLIGIAVTTLLMGWRAKNKAFALLLIPAFIGAYQWQAGDLMKSRAETIDEYKTEESASTRLQAWAAATGMIADHPITGVGLASFGPAFPVYSTKKPREAHNTFFQITAESGVLAGSMYVLLVVVSIITLWRNSARFRQIGMNNSSNVTYLINEAVMASIFGFAVCALFLSLQMSEVFYWLLLMTNVVLFVSRKKQLAAAATSSTEVMRAVPKDVHIEKPRRPNPYSGTVHGRTPLT